MTDTLWDDPIPVASEFRLSESQGVPGPLDDFWYEPIGTANPAGIRVTPESALRVTAVMACIRVLSETMASLPLFVFRQRSDGGKEKAKDHALYNLLHTRRGMPNRWQTAVEFREMMNAHLCLRGNAYAEILPGRRGGVGELIPLHPDRMEAEQLDNRRIRYTLRNPFGGDERRLTQDQVFHIRGISSDGITGLSPIQHASAAVGLATATEAHGSSLFKNGARPGVILEHPGKIDQDASRRLRTDWESLHRGPYKAHRTAVLEGGMKAHELGMTSEDAQFLETRKFQVLEICRIFRVPPHLVYDLERATFSNIENQSIDFVQYGLVPWLTRWEAAISRSLIADDEEFFAEHVLEGLLRGNTNDRFASYAVARQWGWMSINEIRERENLNPIEDGDDHLQPMNMVAVGEEEEQDETQAPPTQPPPEEPDEEVEGDTEESTLPNAPQEALIQSTATRIANAEFLQLERRADKAKDDRDRFDAWMAGWMRSHSEYVHKNIEPFGGDARAVTTQIATGLHCFLLADDVESCFAQFKINRADEIADCIRGAG